MGKVLPELVVEVLQMALSFWGLETEAAGRTGGGTICALLSVMVLSTELRNCSTLSDNFTTFLISGTYTSHLER